MSMPARALFSILVTSILVCVGCSGSTPSTDAPAKAAEDWYVAVNTLEQLKADSLVCQEQREQFRQDLATGSVFLLAGELLLGGEVDLEFDASGISFTTIEDYGDAAIVEARGEMRGAVGGVIHSEEIDEEWLMKNEGGEWKWCGNAQPGDSDSTSAPTNTSTQPIASATKAIVEEKESTPTPEVEPTDPPVSDSMHARIMGAWQRDDEDFLFWFGTNTLLIGSETMGGSDQYRYSFSEPNLLTYEGESEPTFEIESVDENTLQLRTQGDSLMTLTRVNTPTPKEGQHEMLYPFNNDSGCGYINQDGEVIREPIFAACYEFSDGLASVAPYKAFPNLFGFIDLSGNIAISPISFLPSEFSEDMAAVFVPGEGAFGYIDRQGEFVIPPQYDDAAPFSEGVAYVNNLDAEFEGFIDKAGNVAIEIPAFLKGTLGSRSQFRDGLVYTEGGYLDKNGDFLSAESSRNFSEGLVSVDNDIGGCHFVDTAGNVVIQTNYDQCNSFSESLAAVYREDPWGCGYIDKRGELVIEIQFDQCYEFSEGRAAIAIGDRHGYVDEDGKYVVDPNDSPYMWAYQHQNGLAQVIMESGEMGYIDLDGNLVFSSP